MVREYTSYRGKKKAEERDYNADEFRKEENTVIVKARLVQDRRSYPTLFNECATCGERYPLVGMVDFDFCSEKCTDERVRRSLYTGGQ